MLTKVTGPTRSIKMEEVGTEPVKQRSKSQEEDSLEYNYHYNTIGNQEWLLSP